MKEDIPDIKHMRCPFGARAQAEGRITTQTVRNVRTATLDKLSRFLFKCEHDNFFIELPPCRNFQEAWDATVQIYRKVAAGVVRMNKLRTRGRTEAWMAKEISKEELLEEVEEYIRKIANDYDDNAPKMCHVCEPDGEPMGEVMLHVAYVGPQYPPGHKRYYPKDIVFITNGDALGSLQGQEDTQRLKDIRREMHEDMFRYSHYTGGCLFALPRDYQENIEVGADSSSSIFTYTNGKRFDFVHGGNYVRLEKKKPDGKMLVSFGDNIMTTSTPAEMPLHCVAPASRIEIPPGVMREMEAFQSGSFENTFRARLEHNGSILIGNFSEAGEKNYSLEYSCPSESPDSWKIETDMCPREFAMERQEDGEESCFFSIIERVARESLNLSRVDTHVKNEDSLRLFTAMHTIGASQTE